MKIELKRKMAFAVSMGIVTTGLVSFVLIAFNIGFSPGFVRIWLRSWGVGCLVAIPTILIIGPKVQAWVAKLN